MPAERRRLPHDPEPKGALDAFMVLKNAHDDVRFAGDYYHDQANMQTCMRISIAIGKVWNELTSDERTQAIKHINRRTEAKLRGDKD